MKFIGQYIQDLIARFRSDVYLEDVSSGTIASGGNLGLDSNNKIVKANEPTSHDAVTLAGSLDYITISGQEITRNAIDLTQDVTGTLGASKGGTGLTSISTLLNSNTTKSDVGLGNVENKSSATIRGEIVSGDIPNNAADTSGNAGTATALETARNIAGVSFDGTANISLNNNAITNGAGYTTNTGDIDRVRISTSSGNAEVTSGNADFTLSGTAPIGVTNSGATITIAANDASSSAKGVVELATTGEADTGTDTARAVTPAGLKSHVDARFSYQYISFTGNATVPSDGDWMTLSANGISNHTWNTNLGSGGTTVGSSTVTIPTGAICQGIIVPYDCTLVGYASLIRSVGNHQSKVGLAVGVPTYNDFATYDCTLIAYNAADVSAGPDSNYSQRPVRADFLSANRSMSAGHVIFPLIGSVASNSRAVQWNCTLVLKTLLP